MRALLTDSGSTGARMIDSATVVASILTPDGNSASLVLNDVENGVYQANYVVPGRQGYVAMTIVAAGTTDQGAFTREASAIWTISPRSGEFITPVIDTPVDNDGDGLLEALTIDIPTSVTEPGHYIVTGVLAKAARTISHNSTFMAVSTAGEYVFKMSFSCGDIAQSGVDRPYQLRDVYLFDAIANPDRNQEF